MAGAARNDLGPRRPIPGWLDVAARFALILVALPLGAVLFPWRRLMIMSYRNGQGRATRLPWLSFSPAPTRIRRNGLLQVGECVDRLLTSQSPSISLILVLRDQRGALGLFRREGNVELWVPMSDADESREASIRRFFAARDLTPSLDYLTAKGRPPDSSRFLQYPLPDDADRITRIATDYFRELHLATADEGLDFTFQVRSADVRA